MRSGTTAHFEIFNGKGGILFVDVRFFGFGEWIEDTVVEVILKTALKKFLIWGQLSVGPTVLEINCLWTNCP